MYKIQTKTWCSNFKKKIQRLSVLESYIQPKNRPKAVCNFLCPQLFQKFNIFLLYYLQGEITEFQMFWVVACFCTVRERSWGGKDTGLLYFTLLGYETSFVYLKKKVIQG